MRDFFIILGNGFTIDFLNHIKKNNEIDVLNLFSHGDRVPYPLDKEPGFLSYKRCPNLWNLGARPYMDKDECMGLIEDIITCANIASSAKERHLDSTYIQAYQELTSYLKYLFVYYNKKINDDEIKDNLAEWGWLKLFKTLNESSQCGSVTIVTYNYDIWLERILINNDINFEICGFKNGEYKEGESAKFKIIKPHGSISFKYGAPIEPARFQITSTTRDLINGSLSQYQVSYTDLEDIHMFNAMIPPAGDSAKITSKWSFELRALAKGIATELNYSAELILSGLSYWHVDRTEIDELLTDINADINMKVINPKPSNTLSAVLTSLFEKNIIYRSSDILGDIYE
ncbi:hypothetical protein BCY92_04220 [Bacillus wiedmannii]|uniref:hypothetical protein n=1 Tax=Bacillus wiedmannii TaxID=1890302 RepID=UPI000E70F6CE|nr:hypothetical protein BCY92_04220 [Bacillus wiedmannii]